MARKKGLTINKVRSALYLTAKLLGDVQAVSKSASTGSATPVTKRVGRRLAGKVTGRLLGKLFR